MKKKYHYEEQDLEIHIFTGTGKNIPKMLEENGVLTSIASKEDVSHLQRAPNPLNNDYFSVPFYIMYMLRGLLAVLGNSLVVFAVFRYKELWTSNNLLLASLSTANLLVGKYWYTNICLRIFPGEGGHPRKE